MKTPKQFDFKRYPKRRIALLILYMGWEFDGLVTQANTENTIEEHIFRALLKTKLVENREGCGWTRCGRTDKGVSAFRQVAALTVRSTDVLAEGHFWPEDSAEQERRISTTTELPYVKMCSNFDQNLGIVMLNGVLPRAIRVLAYAPVPKEFSARFDCLQRVYTYIFPRASIIDLSRLNDACSRLSGTHDFRNFCHIDRNQGRLDMSYIRTINFANVETMGKPIGSSPSTSSEPFELLKLIVKANGFLWHQIRCIVSLLWEIGCGNEEPEIIDELFDINKFPARPQYKLANELPLCLFDCTFPEGTLEWHFDDDSLQSIICVLQRIWAEHQIKAANVKAMLDALTGIGHKMITNGLEEFVRSEPTTKNYIPLRKRPCCDGLEERRRKIKLKKPMEEEEKCGKQNDTKNMK